MAVVGTTQPEVLHSQVDQVSPTPGVIVHVSLDRLASASNWNGDCVEIVTVPVFVVSQLKPLGQAVSTEITYKKINSSQKQRS